MKQISDFAGIITKGTTPSTIGGSFLSEGINFLKVESITGQSTVDIDSISKISREIHNKLSRSELKENDLLITIAGALGRTYVVEKKILPANTNQAVGIIRLDQTNCNPHFISYWIKTPWIQKLIENINAQSIQNNLNLVNVGNLPTPDHKLRDQNQIAEVLCNIDKKIQLNNKINAELEAMAKTIYDYWFVQFDFPDKNGKPYKSSGGKMVWSEKLKRDIPKGWEVKTLLDIAEYTNGLACQKFKPVNGKTLRVIKIREMREGFSKDTELVKEDIPKKVIVEDGDVLFSWSASLEVQVWAGGKGGLNQHIFKVTSRKFPRSFYYFQLLDYIGHFKMMAENRKTTMGHITQEHLIQSRIVLPPQQIIGDLDKKIRSMIENIVLNKKQNLILREIRDWLLPMLMNGQVKVDNLESS